MINRENPCTANSLIETPKDIFRRGFTLIELSIVLVVIGLIVGGILVGQNLIYAASIRGQIKQIEQLETAYNTFNAKYSCLPGDCANATNFFGTTDANGYTVVNGDGNGTIQGNYDGGGGGPYVTGECLQPDVTGEVAQALLQLNDAGLGNYTANGNPTNTGAVVGKMYPAVSFGNGTGFFISCLASIAHPTVTPAFLNSGNVIVVGAASNNFRIGYDVGSYSSTVSPIGLPIDVVRQIDSKIDDGIPNSGKFGAISGSTACGGINVTTYPAPTSTCTAVAGKRIN